jgi:hypothetical protein
VDIADDGDWRANVYDVGFSHKDLLCFCTYFAEEGLVKELFAEELFNACIKVERCHAIANSSLCLCLHLFVYISRQPPELAPPFQQRPHLRRTVQPYSLKPLSGIQIGFYSCHPHTPIWGPWTGCRMAVLMARHSGSMRGCLARQGHRKYY